MNGDTLQTAIHRKNNTKQINNTVQTTIKQQKQRNEPKDNRQCDSLDQALQYNRSIKKHYTIYKPYQYG